MFDIPILAVAYEMGTSILVDDATVAIMSADALALFEILLYSNAARMEESIPRLNNGGTKCSFLLPIGQLVDRNFASLRKDVGCAVCSRCPRAICAKCQSVAYCDEGE